jgi:hypothetical protein
MFLMPLCGIDFDLALVDVDGELSWKSATHLHSRAIGERWYRRFFGLFLLRFLCDRLRCLCRLDLACTPKK